MKKPPLFSLACAMFLLSCTKPVERCDRLQIDNPTGEDYFLIVDNDTLPLPAYTYIRDYEAVCSPVDANGNPTQTEQGMHRFIVLDANKQQIFDTTFKVADHYAFINPTRSTYVELKVYYGDEQHEERYKTIMLDSAEYTADLEVYNAFTFETIAGGVLNCDRNIEGTMEIFNEQNNYQFYFYRQEDFEVAYSGFAGSSPKEDAETEMYNLMIGFYNAAVDDPDRKLISDNGMSSLYDAINYKHYSEAWSALNSPYFQMMDENKFAELESYYELYSSLQEPETMVLPFTEYHCVQYAMDEDYKLYMSLRTDYDPSTGECATDYLY
jgi:hypothetical protein